MRRIIVISAGLLLGTSAWAGTVQTVASLQPSGASADKVYPPLPSLTMLPPASGDDDEPVSHSAPASRKKKTRHVAECSKCGGGSSSAPMARLVVSDASRAYLKDIEHQLDVALSR
ncbi:conserved exported protein of unknown function [Burkholderia multivorans]